MLSLCTESATVGGVIALVVYDFELICFWGKLHAQVLSNGCGVSCTGREQNAVFDRTLWWTPAFRPVWPAGRRAVLCWLWKRLRNQHRYEALEKLVWGWFGVFIKSTVLITWSPLLTQWGKLATLIQISGRRWMDGVFISLVNKADYTIMTFSPLNFIVSQGNQSKGEIPSSFSTCGVKLSDIGITTKIYIIFAAHS